MPNISELPPAEYLMQVADHCCEAVSAYLMLWRDQDKDGICVYTKEQVEDIKCLDWCDFKRHLRLLAYEGVIERVCTDNKITVIMAAWEEQLEAFI